MLSRCKNILFNNSIYYNFKCMRYFGKDAAAWTDTNFRQSKFEVEKILKVGISQLQNAGVYETAKKLKIELDKPDLWDDPQRAAKITKDYSRNQNKIDKLERMTNKVEELSELVELAVDEGVSQNRSMLDECSNDIEKLMLSANKFRLELLLAEPTDRLGCYIEVTAGMGGTESMHFAEMLLHMYQKWGQESGYNSTITETSPGPEAGIRNGILHIEGENAYGWAKAESGVHRMVRISEYDTAHRRHTCFAQVSVLPATEEDDEDADFQIDPTELRIDRYRSSGPGGQHVNTTDSAVRLTHIPTGVVAQSQDGRSQHHNFDCAMRVLKARLLQRKLDAQVAEKSAFKAQLGDNSWGNQIRSYVLHPYKMVKDHRTGHETSQADQVLEGNPEFLTPFMESTLVANSKLSKSN